MSTALLTEHYELTMLTAALRDGTAGRRAVFEVFARRLPAGRRYGVFGGLGRLLDALDEFRFDGAQLDWLRGRGFLDDDALDWLRAYRFAGDVVAYREGELYFAHSPVLTVEATFGEALLLETLVLSVLNHDSAVASAGARMVDAASGVPLLEMGGRRTHEAAAVAAARIAHLVGFAATSNLEAGRRYDVPTSGTAAHAFTLAHVTERDAFASQLDTFGVDTTLLVDTFDVDAAIRTAVELARERGADGPGGIRIDSGELVHEARRARALLDELGALDTRVVVSGDLDEYLIEDLVERRAPVGGFGVGTKLVTGSGHPTASFVYKLVAVEGDDGRLRPVAKRSVAKAGTGGRKLAHRLLDGDGFVATEHVDIVDERLADAVGGRSSERGRPLQVVAVDAGRRVHDPTNDEIRSFHRDAMAELRPLDRLSVAGPPVTTAEVVP
jgi:nicotinate phosphoribosyltransferase